LRIKEHKTVKGISGDRHHHLIIDWFDREWKILLNDNYKTQTTTAHLWDDEWRSFDGRSLEEAVVYDWIKSGKIIKLKYKVQ